MYTGWYHLDPLEPVTSCPGHHIHTEFHAWRHVQKKRGRAIRVQSHRCVLIHGDGSDDVGHYTHCENNNCWQSKRTLILERNDWLLHGPSHNRVRCADNQRTIVTISNFKYVCDGKNRIPIVNNVSHDRWYKVNNDSQSVL